MEWMRWCTNITDFEVDRAKNMLRTKLFSQANNNAINCDTIGTQMLGMGRKVSLKELDEKLCVSILHELFFLLRKRSNFVHRT